MSRTGILDSLERTHITSLRRFYQRERNAHNRENVDFARGACMSGNDAQVIRAQARAGELRREKLFLEKQRLQILAVIKEADAMTDEGLRTIRDAAPLALELTRRQALNRYIGCDTIETP